MRREGAGAAIVLAVLGTVAACGGGSSMSSMPGMSTAPSSAGPAISGTAVVIENFAFSPTTLKVTAGTTVTWTNDDQAAHTVTATGGGGFSSPALQHGQTYRFRFTTPGSYAYHCTIHPFMTATVVVTK